MEPFRSHTGVVAPLGRPDIDTDQIIPKQFLKRVERSGYGQFLFYDWRFDPSGAKQDGFVLNRPEYADASILVTGRNFGCGSSREHAAWSIHDYGFRVVIASSFADIFRENSDQNGLVTVELPEAHIEELLHRAAERTPYRLTVDLEGMRVFDDQGFEATFQMDPFRRTCLLKGLDRIGLTLEHGDAIAAYEARVEGRA